MTSDGSFIRQREREIMEEENKQRKNRKEEKCK
jgi:hypothetical protein